MSSFTETKVSIRSSVFNWKKVDERKDLNRIGCIPYFVSEQKKYYLMYVSAQKHLSDLGGGIKKGKALESPLSALQREVKEEHGSSDLWDNYILPALKETPCWCLEKRSMIKWNRANYPSKVKSMMIFVRIPYSSRITQSFNDNEESLSCGWVKEEDAWEMPEYYVHPCVSPFLSYAEKRNKKSRNNSDQVLDSSPTAKSSHQSSHQSPPRPLER